MPVSMNNTQVVFNDATTQTTAPVNTNANVTSVSAGTGISVSATTGALTVTNSGVTSVNGATGAVTVGAAIGDRGTVFTSSGTFTIPTGITALKITVGGGGGGGGVGQDVGDGSGTGGQGQSGGGAIKYLTGLTPGNTLTVTVGAGGGSGTAGGTSSVASGTQSITTISGTGGGGGGTGTGGGNGTGSVGTGATGTNGDINVDGIATNRVMSTFSFGVNAPPASIDGFANITGKNGTGRCSGGSGGLRVSSGSQSGGSGTAGIVVIEF